MKRFTVFHKVIGLFNSKYAKKAKRLAIYRDALLNKHGIEIGGPSRIFTDKGSLPIYSVVSALDGCNYSNVTIWNEEMEEGDGRYRYDAERTGHQFIREASDLKGIENGKYDFLLASHCLEHCANPIRTLTEWKRVVRPGGFLLIVLPHKNGTFDHRRPVTSLDHMIDDFRNEIGEDDLTHLDEILALHDFGADSASGTMESFKERSLNNLVNRCLHHHVFDGLTAATLIDYCGLEIVDAEVRRPYHIILLAGNTSERPKNGPFLNKKYYSTISPFGD